LKQVVGCAVFLKDHDHVLETCYLGVNKRSAERNQHQEIPGGYFHLKFSESNRNLAWTSGGFSRVSGPEGLGLFYLNTFQQADWTVKLKDNE
jgi:hypothetical protein